MYGFCMDCYGFLWISLDTCIDFCWNYGSLTIEMVAHYWNGGSLLKWWLTIGMVAHY